MASVNTKVDSAQLPIGTLTATPTGLAMDQALNFYRYKMTQHEQERIEWQE